MLAILEPAWSWSVKVGEGIHCVFCCAWQSMTDSVIAMGCVAKLSVSEAGSDLDFMSETVIGPRLKLLTCICVPLCGK